MVEFPKNKKAMNFSSFDKENPREVIDLFQQVFSASEGEPEGQLIAGFVSRLITTTPSEDLVGCVAEDNDGIVGCIFFSRFFLSNDQLAYILSPVAVATAAQGKGVGQQLIQYGLDQLLMLNVNLVLTYGDPAYYSKTGFEPIDEALIPAPCPLSQPIGWLAQSLDGSPIQAVSGPTRCVEALKDPELW